MHQIKSSKHKINIPMETIHTEQLSALIQKS
jgi:hypothetical protein